MGINTAWGTFSVSVFGREFRLFRYKNEYIQTFSLHFYITINRLNVSYNLFILFHVYLIASYFLKKRPELNL